jgi:nucleoid-associated protein YgaU
MARPNPLTEPLEPYEPTSSFDSHEDYDWDYEGGRDRAQPMNILWGRVAVLGALLLVAFLAGRAMAGGGDGIPASELAAARDNIETLTAENDSLRGDVATLETQVAELESAAAVAPTDTTAGDAVAEDPAADIGTFQEYTVKPGDTLTLIAEKFYDDASLDNYLAEVNNIDDPTSMHAGDVLKIPDNPPSQ